MTHSGCRRIFVSIAEEKAALMFDLWTVDGSPVIEFDRRVMDEIRAIALDGHLRIRHGGVEIGGVLFGVHEAGRVRISAHRVLECEHACGPSFKLSSNDEAQLSALLKAAAVDTELSGLVPVGWYHSHTRSDIFLSEEDLQLHSRYFPEPWQVALVIKPRALEPTRAGFFFRNPDGSIHAASSLKVFTLEPLPREQKAEASIKAGRRAVEVPPRTSAETPNPLSPPKSGSTAAADLVPVNPPVIALTRPVPVARSPLRQRKFRLGRISIAAGLIVAAMAAGLTLRSNSQPSSPPALGLRLVGAGEQISIEWNGSSDIVRGSKSATLEITDGGGVQSLPLEATALKTGSVTYVRQSGNVGVKLTVRSSEGTVQERAHFIGPPVVKQDLTEVVDHKPPVLTPVPEPEAGKQVTAPPAAVVKSPTPRRRPIIRFGNATRPAAVLLPVEDLPRLEFLAAKPQPSSLGSAIPLAPPTAPPPTAPRETVRSVATPISGRAIWTGLLRRRGVLRIDGARASTGFVSAPLPDRRLQVSAYPAELSDGGLLVYVPNRRSPASEAPGPHNGWNHTFYEYDPNRARDVAVVEAGKSFVAIRSERRDVSMVVLDWTAVE